jgi:ribonuclease VapC
MFVDASAIVAVLTGEPEAGALIDSLERAIQPITSAIAIFEDTLGLHRKRRSSVEEAYSDVTDFLTQTRTMLVPIEAAEATAALKAFSRYGKGQGHPAQLNMGDCFAYAVAKTHRKTMLYTGNDFTGTDIEAA